MKSVLWKIPKPPKAPKAYVQIYLRRGGKLTPTLVTIPRTRKLRQPADTQRP